MLTKEFAELIVHATSGRKERIIKNLQEHGFSVKDDSEAMGKMNLKVSNPDGTMIRIYDTGKKVRGRKDIRVQEWKPVTFKYSGIPTFEPSRRASF